MASLYSFRWKRGSRTGGWRWNGRSRTCALSSCRSRPRCCRLCCFSTGSWVDSSPSTRSCSRCTGRACSTAHTLSSCPHPSTELSPTFFSTNSCLESRYFPIALFKRGVVNIIIAFTYFWSTIWAIDAISVFDLKIVMYFNLNCECFISQIKRY